MMNEFNMKYIAERQKQTGSMLIVIIITIVVISVLGLAIYILTSTAVLNQVVAHRASRAFYLSESGIRIATSEYNAATNKNARLVALHNKQITMPDNIGKITILSNPYWFYATAADAAASTSTTLRLHLPGNVPPADENTSTPLTFPAKGFLKIRDDRTTDWIGDSFVEYTGAAVGNFDSASGGTPVTFTLAKALSNAILEYDEFYIGKDGYSVSQAPSTSDPSLILTYTDVNAANIFPPQKGTIFICKNDIAFYKYDLRSLNKDNHTIKLINIQPIDSDQSPKWKFLNNSLKTSDRIYIGRTVGFTSEGTFGE